MRTLQDHATPIAWPGLHAWRLLAALAVLCASTVAPAADLTVDLALQRSEILVGDQLVVLVSLMNTGSEPVVLRGTRDLSPGGGFRLSIINANGQELPVPPRAGLSLADARNGPTRRVLAPDEGIAVPFFIDLIGHARNPGAYSLKATYQSPIPTPNNPSINPRHREGITAEPATIAFQVKAVSP